MILVIAFLALGPSKSIEMARGTGKVLGVMRRTFNEITAAVTLDDVDEALPRRRPNTSAATSKDEPTPNQLE